MNDPKDVYKVVLIANDDHPIPDYVDKKFKAAGIEWSYQQCYNRADLEKCPKDADLLWLMSGRKGLVIEENLDLFPTLKAAVKIGSGTDNIDRKACTKRGIVIAHTPEEMTECTSDHFVAMLLTVARQTAAQDRLVRSGIWNARNPLALGPLTGAELGLIGFGKVGKAIIQKLSGFKMKVRVFDPYVDAGEIETAGCKKAELHELLKASQYVVVACPLTEQTTKLLGEKEFNMMRPDSAIINCARGAILDQKALINALKNGIIKAAALDVVENPPLKLGDELLTLDNVVITPHAAGYLLPYPEEHFKMVVNVVIELAQGKLPRWIVNREVLSQPNLRIKTAVAPETGKAGVKKLEKATA